MRLYRLRSWAREHSPLRAAGSACWSIALLWLVALGAVRAPAQISPGPLSKAHSFLDGATNCTSCHKVRAQATLKCLECHTEIAARISAGRGLHARLVAPGTASQTCAKCHSEHNGATFPLIRWQPPLSQ